MRFLSCHPPETALSREIGSSRGSKSTSCWCISAGVSELASAGIKYNITSPKIIAMLQS